MALSKRHTGIEDGNRPREALLREIEALRASLAAEQQRTREQARELARLKSLHPPKNEPDQVRDVLKEGEPHLRDVLNNLIALVGVLTPDGILIEANRYALKAAGLSPSDVLGKPFEECYWWAWSPEVQKRLRKAIGEAAAGRGSRYDAVIQVGENAFRTIDFMLSPMFGPDGRISYLIPSATDITERKEAEEEIRRNEATLNAVLESLPVGVVIADKQGGLLRVNRVINEIWGLHPETKNWEQYQDWVGFWPDTGERLMAHEWAMSRALLEGETVVGQLVECEQFGTGRRRFIINNAAPIRDASGEITAGVVVEIDVTDQKRAEQALRESRERYQLVNRATNDIIWDWNLTTDELSWNKMVESAVGKTRAEMEPTIQSWRRHIHPEDRDRVLKGIHRSIDTGENTWRDEYRFGPVGGPWRTYLDRGLIARDENGNAYRMIGSMLDLTERRRAEEALQYAHGLLEGITRGSEDMIAAEDKDFRYIFFNNAYRREFQRLWGRDIEIGTNMLEALAPWPEDQQKAKDLWRRALDGETFSITLGFGPSKQEKQIYDLRYNPVYDSEGRQIGAAHTLRNVTEQVRMQEALKHLNETLEQQVAERTAIAEVRSKQLQSLAVELIEAEERERRRIAGLLHDDLQQLLAGARMQLQTAVRSIPENPVIQNVEKLMEESIEKARGLSHELSPAVLHYSGLVPALQWLVRKMSEQFDMTVELDIDMAHSIESAPLKDFLFRVVQELLFNVFKHAGVKTARVHVSAFDDRLSVTVRDRGKGFDPAALETATAESGIGLLSLRERARSIGGALKIESRPGKGSRFDLSVPLDLPIPDKTAPVGTATDRQPVETAEVSKSQKARALRVVFADDHLVMRRALIRTINDQPDIQVVGEAENGREAVELVRQLQPDLVVMDVTMPEMDGVRATRRIKAEWPRVRVVGLSMFEDDHIAQAMRRAGAEAFVSKTASSGELLKAIYGEG
ncbi:MAG: PAS domain-containing protein [Desulfococcaceae bacterium]